MDKSLDQEKKELDILIGRGVSFDVEQTYYKRVGLINRKKVSETVKYHVYEPTLATLDRISSEQIKLKIDENIMSSMEGVSEAKKLTSDHSRRMARILAIAVLGQDYIIPIQHGNGFKYKYDEKRLNQLAETFFTFIKPSKLFKLTLLVNTISNLGDFTNSIRLMSASRTTMPIRVEADKEA